jgi:hypothetical protein
VPPFGDITGKGLLDARALWASIVGQQRLAMGAKQSFVVKANQSVKIGDNIGAADAYVLLGVAGTETTPGTPTFVLFSKDDIIGEGSGIPYMFGIFGASPAPPPFTQLLLPGEQLFVQLSATALVFGVTEARLVVSQVTF